MVIRDANGYELGRIESRGDEEVAVSRNGQTLGYYKPDSNKTYDVGGQPVGEGNHLAALIHESA